jgi:Na+(H+)/acetate symporter ActP
VQRILTNPTVRESRMALLISAFAKIPMQIAVLFIGVVLFVFHVLHPPPLLFRPGDRAVAAGSERVAAIETDYVAAAAERRRLALELAAQPGGPTGEPERLAAYQREVLRIDELRQQARSAIHGKDEDDVNYVFPHFLLHHVPVVLLGLIMAAIFAAAMSSVDSALNSLASATIVDFYRRWIRPRASEREALQASRLATLGWGALATGAALWLGGGGSVIEQINQIGSFFYGALLGTFTLGLLFRRAGEIAGVAAVLGGIGAVLVVHRTLQVEFLWYNVVGCLGALTAGGIASALDGGAPRAPALAGPSPRA